MPTTASVGNNQIGVAEALTAIFLDAEVVVILFFETL